jgi:shikimate dehydrogenase
VSRRQNFLSLITGSFSSPAADNPTVAMVESAYRNHNIDARYLNCEVTPEALGDAVRGARAMGWAGFNCSIPHKISVIGLLDGLAASAKIIGAVNCVVRRGNDLIGENTDGQGFLASLRTVVDPVGKNVVLLGAGGAARAIAVETALAGASAITVVNRDPHRGQDLAELLQTKTPTESQFVPWNAPYRIHEAADIIVNATSIGLFPDVDAAPPIDVTSFHPHLVVADVIPNPPRTAFLKMAERRGCVTLDGLGMLVNQGVISIEHWTGIAADPAVMRHTLNNLFGT